MKFAELILPLPIPGFYTYAIPEEFSGRVEPGHRVLVPVGKRKIYTAIVHHLHNNEPENYKAKEILDVLDKHPVVNMLQLAFWDWLRKYYLATPGDVMAAALPAGMKLSSESRFSLSENYKGESENLSDEEYLIVEALETQKYLQVSEISDILNKKTVLPLIRKMEANGIIEVSEEVAEKFKPKIESYVRLSQKADNEQELEKIFQELKRFPKQETLLMSLINLTNRYGERKPEVKKAALMAASGVSSSVFNTLLKKGILEAFDVETGRLSLFTGDTIAPFTLSSEQQQALTAIKQEFTTKNTVLFHGITSSGKTELYIHLMQECVQQNKQVLYLLPEIALTSQIIDRLKRVFGSAITIYHSRLSNNERVEVWNEVLKSNSGNSAINIILGARSSVLLPYANLGLIIVDEEHEPAFKQHEAAPRYNARDAAIYLASLHEAKVLLGSATPSIESYYNAHNGKYGYVALNSRFGKAILPDIQIVNIREEYKKAAVQGNFSQVLIEHIKLALSNKEQIILFQNRRGFSPYIECTACNWIPECKNCNVTLTYHKHINMMKCHYCGYAVPPFVRCNNCGGTELKTKGFGTQKIEEDLAVIIPEAVIARMDYDTTQKKNSYYRIINDFSERRIDILVGTQMVSKGLDFENVAVVGILNADNMLNYPDFRAYERSYQLMAQVSGRAGRKEKQGKVILQTFHPNHQIIKMVASNSYKAMYEAIVKERYQFKYPPFYRLILVRIKHRDQAKLRTAAVSIADGFRKVLGDNVLGPEYPVVFRIRNMYINEILIKIDKKTNNAAVKQFLQENVQKFHEGKYNSGYIIQYDVDPL